MGPKGCLAFSAPHSRGAGRGGVLAFPYSGKSEGTEFRSAGCGSARAPEPPSSTPKPAPFRFLHRNPCGCPEFLAPGLERPKGERRPPRSHQPGCNMGPFRSLPPRLAFRITCENYEYPCPVRISETGRAGLREVSGLLGAGKAGWELEGWSFVYKQFSGRRGRKV